MVYWERCNVCYRNLLDFLSKYGRNLNLRNQCYGGMLTPSVLIILNVNIASTLIPVSG